MFAHPIGLPGSMLVRDVVADVVAVLEQPQFCPAARLCRDTFSLFCWHKPVAYSLDDEQGASNLLRHSLQVELLQFVHRVFNSRAFKAIDVRFAAYQGSLREVLAGVIRAAVLDGRPQFTLECSG